MVDVTAPVLANATPANGAVNVAVNASLLFDVVDPGEPSASALENITGADYFLTEDVSAFCDGTNSIFPLSTPVHPDGVEFYLDGVLQNGFFSIVVTDPEAGEVTITPFPPAGVGTIRYRQGFFGNATDLATVVLTVNGVAAFQNTAWEAGWAGTLEPITAGYRWNITTHPDFVVGLNTVEVVAEDRFGNAALLTWTFNAIAVSLSGGTVEDDGGYAFEIHGVFTDVPHAVVIRDGGTDYPCYGGTSGEGYSPRPKSGGTVLRAVTPPLPIGGPYELRVTFGVTTLSFPNAVTVVARNWSTKTLALRGMLPPWYKVGPRNLDSVDLLV